MKLHKIPLFTGIIGLIIIVLSIYRWWFVWYDPSQMIIMCGFGILILVGSYVYNWMKIIDDRINIEMNDFRDRVEKIAKWWMGEELE